MIITVLLAISCIVAVHQEAFVLSSSSSSSSSSLSSKAFELFSIHCSLERKREDLSFPEGDTLPVNNEDFHKVKPEPLLVWCKLLLHSKNEFLLQVPLKHFDKYVFTSAVNKSTGAYRCLPSIDLKLTKNRLILFVYNFRSDNKQWSENIYHRIVKRDALPDGFQEDVDLDILDTIEQNAPEPRVAIEVRQNGQLINDMVTVIPGTPLELEIRLMDSAANIYGTHVNFVEVSNGGDNSETIVFRGCTIDPYLFENFIRTPNNTLQANFRAFKFPNTAFVQFRVNIQICLRKCQVVHCLNGQGRAKREVTSDYEVSLGIKLRVGGYNKVNEEEIQKTEYHVKLLMGKQVDLKTLL